VQLAGHDFLKNLGVALVPATAPDFFTEDTPTAVLVRQVLGAIAQFEKAALVAKLKAARDRKIAKGIKCGGRKTYLERDPGLVEAAKELSAQRPRLSLRKIAAALAERGYVVEPGWPYPAASVRNMIEARRPRKKDSGIGATPAGFAPSPGTGIRTGRDECPAGLIVPLSRWEREAAHRRRLLDTLMTRADRSTD
jgi:hypothetical protein